MDYKSYLSEFFWLFRKPFAVCMAIVCIAFLIFLTDMYSAVSLPYKESLLEKRIGVSRINLKTFDTINKTIHVIVALCDNKFQGILPVPEKIGNGQDPTNNLYWGCGYGVRSFFKNSKEWKLIRIEKKDTLKLERLIFKHISKNYYLVADAYNGKYIKQSIIDFFYSCSGQENDTIHVNNTSIGCNGNAALIAYVGHDGLMDFQLTEKFENTDGMKRKCIILSCISKTYFSPYLKTTGAIPVVWSTGLMSPEAYTLHDALSAFVNNESNESVRTKAALAYSKYQKCTEKAARNLLVTGW